MTPWEALCANLIGPYTLKGKNGTQIDFMCLRMVELPVMETITPIESKNGTKTHEIPKETYFDRTPTMISFFIKQDLV